MGSIYDELAPCGSCGKVETFRGRICDSCEWKHAERERVKAETEARRYSKEALADIESAVKTSGHLARINAKWFIGLLVRYRQFEEKARRYDDANR